jgi:isoquinoline 1-oxidoreductase beta subunit
MCIDAGLVVNPDRVVSQMEGAAIFGMSLALHGEITAKDGAVAEGNFDTYPMCRIAEVPHKIHAHIMESDALPGGVGEPGVPPVAPAIVNAYFAATGQRIRELPLRNAGLV